MLQLAELVATDPASRRWHLHDDCSGGNGLRLRRTLEIEPQVCGLVRLGPGSSSDRQRDRDRARGSPTVEKVKGS